MEYLIPLILVLPVLGAIGCALVSDGRAARMLAFGVSVACFVLALPLIWHFDFTATGAGMVQYVSNFGTVSFPTHGSSMFAVASSTPTLLNCTLAEWTTPLQTSSSPATVRNSIIWATDKR